MSKLDTNHVVNLDLVKDRVNSVIKFGLADVETSDFYLGLYNNGSRVFDKDYIVTLYIVKPNGTFRNIKLEPKEGLKKYYCNLPDTLKNIVGEYVCQVMVFDNLTGEKKISKSKFKYSVSVDLASEMAGIIDEEEQESILTNILNRLLTLENPVEPYATQKHVDECVSMLTEEIDSIKIKDVDQDGRLVNIESKNVNQDNRLDIIEAKDIEQDNRLVNIESKNTEQDGRLDITENRLANIGNDITNTMQPIIDEHTSRLEAIEAIDVSQNTRLDAIEVKNQQQDDRLLDIEKVNSRQDIDIKCLYGASQTIDISKEGNSIYLQNSNNGFAVVDEICGNTMVNCNKEPDKEIILNGNINTQGYSNVTLTEGVDGGKVDVALEGNTMVNVCDQKDPVAITNTYTVKTGNHVALQGEYDGKCRPVITGNTLWIDNATGEVLTAFDNSKDLRLQSSFEDKVVTQEMVDAGEELAENLGKYKVDYAVTGKNKFDGELELGNINYNNGNPSNSSNILRSKNFIKIKPSTTYKITSLNKGDVQYVFEYDNNNEFIKFTTVYGSVTTDSNTSYIKIKSQLNGANGYVLPTTSPNIQIEEGTEATPYEPYKEYKKTFYLNSPLLEGDTIEQSRDNIVHVHRYKKVVLDGSEKWTKSSNKRENYYRAYTSIANSSNPVICDKFNNKNVQGLDEEGINIAGVLDLQISNSKLSEVSTTGLKAYLQSNPVTVVYKLRTPTYEVISQNDTILCDSYVNGHLDVDSAVPIEKVDFLHFEEELTYLYVDTQYAVQFVSDAVSKVDITLGGAELLNQDVVIGTNKYTITTPSELIDNNLVLNGIGFNASNIVVTETTDQDFGYFEGMKSVGECEDLAVVSSNSDNTLSTTQTLTHEPLRAVGDIKDKYVLIDGKWYIERNCGYRNNYSICDAWSNENLTNRRLKLFKLDNSIEEFDDMSALRKVKSNKFKCVQYGYIDGRFNVPFLAYITENGNLWVSADINYTQQDMLNYIKDCQFVYELPSPTYEPIDYNPFTVYSDITHISNNSTVPCNMTIKNTGYNCLLKPSTTYTVSSNLGLNVVTTPSTLTEDCLRFYDTDTSTVTTMNNVMVLEGDYTTGKPLPSHFSGIESAFEQEYDEVVGKYKVKARVQNKDATKENYIEFYINEPLRGIGDVSDKVYVKNDKVVVERNCGQREYQDGDFGTYLTDKVNTVYPLAEPTYEEVEYNDVKLFIESFKNSTLFYNSNVPVTSTVHYSYSVPIVDTVAQTANISDQQDSMIIDLATQCAVMEIMLM